MTLSLQLKYRRLTRGGECFPKAYNISIMAIDSLSQIICKKRQMQDTTLIRQLGKPYAILLYYYSFEEARVVSSETCFKYPIKTMGYTWNIFTKTANKMIFKIVQYFLTVVCINSLNAITQLVKVLDDIILGDKS